MSAVDSNLLHQRTFSLTREVSATVHLVKRDLSASLIPGVLMTLSASIATQAVSLGSLLKAGLYFSCYIYVFCLANQIVGKEEDVINKPDRPLPSGLWTIRDAWLRFVCAAVLFPIVGLTLGGVQLAGWAVMWLVVLTVYNWGKWDRHWFTKNVGFITFGTIALLGAGWTLASPLTSEGLRWVLFISGAFGVTLHLQDFRDVAGDSETGRKTLPIAFGDSRARALVAVSLLALPVAAHFILFAHNVGPVARASELLLAVFNAYVAVRLVRRRTPDADHLTYMMHTYWFCLIVLLAGPAIRSAALFR